MRNPIGQLIATKDGKGWILGMVVKPYQNPYASSDVYEIEWYCEDGNVLKTHLRRAGGDLLRQMLTAYRHKVVQRYIKEYSRGTNALQPLAVGQLILDKYGRLAIIIDIDGYNSTVEVEWLNPRHGRMLFQMHKIEELRRNYLFLRERMTHGWA